MLQHVFVEMNEQENSLKKMELNVSMQVYVSKIGLVKVNEQLWNIGVLYSNLCRIYVNTQSSAHLTCCTMLHFLSRLDTGENSYLASVQNGSKMCLPSTK